jgi:hypothetical protein
MAAVSKGPEEDITLLGRFRRNGDRRWDILARAETYETIGSLLMLQTVSIIGECGFTTSG